ncbi:MAG: protein kinase, partial [Phycisphaerales bacterium]|nr:protein kinase [Phycisphaerales bacterium]
IREIGRGGMGIVYECEQQHPRRRVAVKVVESLLYARELNQRLAAEAQIQGQLQHPGIARVYDAGIAKIGRSRRPYFVMELIDGRPLHAYADAHKLTQHDKATLISKVCDGMMHAHERGIIHRDLKPENILVEKDGQPKILDFGIARFVGDSTLAATTMTREGQILGTLAYMAPEQLAGNPDLITARSDVYAIGAIMYELLLGHPPVQLEGMSISAAFRAIETEEPVRLRRINREINSDIETIIMRCLSREPERRFANAGELADDLRRSLADRPIRSRPPTKRYRAGKFIKRNKLLVGGVSATMLALSAGLVFSMYFAAGQHSARLVAEEQQRIARGKELDAIQGVLGGASTLAANGQRWEATRQILTVDPGSRGWEWNHLAIELPWVLTLDRWRYSYAEGGSMVATYGFTDNTTLLLHDPLTNALFTRDVLTDTVRKIPLDGIGVYRADMCQDPIDGKICVQLDDGRIGLLDLETGLFTLWFSVPADENVRLRTVSPDRSIVACQKGTLLTMYKSGEVVYEIDSGINDPVTMNWNMPIFSPDSSRVYLTNYGNNGEYIALDTATWEELGRIPSPNWGPLLDISVDGEYLYLSSIDKGIIVHRASDLAYIDSIDPQDGRANWLRTSHAGSMLAACFETLSSVRIYDTATLDPIHVYDFEESTLSNVPGFSPNDELFVSHTPSDFRIWIEDLVAKGNPSQTLLKGHSSWMYQLAISPDGSLLASAEPETGDVLLWDLNRDQLLSRFKRPAGAGALVNHMNAPLVFDPSGEALIFAEQLPGTKVLGLSTVDLRTGERSWRETGSINQTIDAVADMVGPGPVFHHAVALPDGRIVQGNAAPAFASRVIARGRAGSEYGTKILAESRVTLWAGSAVHPSGDVYACGEVYMTRIRDARTDEILFEIPNAVATSVYGMTYSPDGSRFAMGTENGRILIFDTEFYKKIADIRVSDEEPDNPRNYIYNLVWTPDGKRLVACGGSTLRVLESERPIVRRRHREQWESDLAHARESLDSSAAHAETASYGALLIAQIEKWASDEPTSLVSRKTPPAVSSGDGVHEEHSAINTRTGQRQP